MPFTSNPFFVPYKQMIIIFKSASSTTRALLIIFLFISSPPFCLCLRTLSVPEEVLELILKIYNNGIIINYQIC